MLYFINELPLISLSTVQWTIENVISLISVFLVGVGGVLALLQWRSASKVKRAEFVNQIIEKLRFDQDMVNAMGMVDYGTIRYDESFHNGTDGKEAQIDKLLSYLSIVCFLRTLHVIQKDEFAFFEYYLYRVYSSGSLCGYLWNLYHFAKKRNIRCPFHFLIKYGVKNKMIDWENFKDPNSNIYNKTLNF